MTESILTKLDYYIDCLNTEGKESFRVLGDKNKFYFPENFTLFEDFFLFDQKFIEIELDKKTQNFIKTQKNIQNSKIYFVLEYIKEFYNRGESLVPLYITEVEMELINKKLIRISKLDYEPTFNYYLLPQGISENEKLNISDDIKKIPIWSDKIKSYKAELSSKTLNKLTIKPFFFISNLLTFVQASVCQEIEWIKKRYINDLKKTAASFLFFDQKTHYPKKVEQELKDTVCFDPFADLKDECPGKKEQDTIEIFQLNKIQKDVVNFALSNPYTVITGPPGTGKSQVVLNLLANIAYKNKTVLFVSKNNKAVNTVIEKLDKVQESYYSGPQCQDSFSFNLSVIFCF